MPYLHAQLVLMEAAGSQQQDRREGRDGAQEAQEGCSESRTHGLPPLTDVWDVQDAGRSSLGFDKNLQSKKTPDGHLWCSSTQ